MRAAPSTHGTGCDSCAWVSGRAPSAAPRGKTRIQSKKQKTKPTKKHRPSRLGRTTYPSHHLSKPPKVAPRVRSVPLAAPRLKQPFLPPRPADAAHRPYQSQAAHAAGGVAATIAPPSVTAIAMVSGTGCGGVAGEWIHPAPPPGLLQVVASAGMGGMRITCRLDGSLRQMEISAPDGAPGKIQIFSPH